MEAITDPKQLSSWYMTQAAIDGRPGGYIDFPRGAARLAGLPFEDFRKRVAELQGQYPTRQEAQ